MSDKEILMIRKATMYDLLRILEKKPNKTYTDEELVEIIDAYIAGLEQ